MNQLDLKPEAALLHKKIQGIVLRCFENERPFKGLIGLLDWRFNGHFSHLMKAQVLTGAAGETVYAPLKWNDQTFHFLIYGSGFVDADGTRPVAQRTSFERARSQIHHLRLEAMGISKQDWGLDVSGLGSMEDPSLWVLN